MTPFVWMETGHILIIKVWTHFGQDKWLMVKLSKYTMLIDFKPKITFKPIMKFLKKRNYS